MGAHGCIVVILALAVAACAKLEIGNVTKPSLVGQFEERLVVIILIRRHVPRHKIGDHELRKSRLLAIGGLANLADGSIPGRRRAGPRWHAELGHHHDHVAVVQGVGLAQAEAIAWAAGTTSGIRRVAFLVGVVVASGEVS